MASTPFDRHNYDFSGYASRIAERTIYADYVRRNFPKAVGWSLIDLGGTRDDLDHGIDRELEVRFIDRIERYTVQERFRRQRFAHFRQLTATDANYASGRAGDFHKLDADLYVYGYLGDDLKWIEAIIVDVDRLKSLYRTGAIIPERAFYKRKSQAILGFPFDKLDQGGAIVWHSRYLP